MKKKEIEQAIAPITGQIEIEAFTDETAPMDSGATSLNGSRRLDGTWVLDGAEQIEAYSAPIKPRSEIGEQPAGFIAPAISPGRQDKEPPAFAPMLQGTGSNKLAQLDTRTTPPEINRITGVAVIAEGDYKVFIDRYNELTGGLRISTHKLLDICAIALTALNHYRGSGDIETSVSIPIDEFMRLCGIPLTKPSKDYTRRRIKEDLETLYNISIEWTERSGKNTKDYAKMRIVTSQGIKRGNILVGFSPEFAKYLTGAYIMHYPTALLKLDERKTSSYILGRELTLHHSIDNNRRKGTANIMSVKALLQKCDGIPSYEEVMSSDRHVDKRIKVPFENALNALSDFITWEYSNSKGVPLTNEQLESVSYSDFIKLYVHFTVKDFPDQTARDEANAARAKKNAAKKKKGKKPDEPV